MKKAALACAVVTCAFLNAETGERMMDVPWTAVHSDVAVHAGAVRVTVWKGYEQPGVEATRLPVTDWSRYKSIRFEVNNAYPEPFSVFVRVSDHADHPAAETYTGGTFDGFVIAPGRNTVEISLENMRSPQEHAVDAARIAYLGIFFEPLFLRDGQDLHFRAERSFEVGAARLSTAAARLQKQPYGDLLFRETDASTKALRAEAETALQGLSTIIDAAKTKNVETAYAEIYPFLARVAFEKRLVAFWQDRAVEQRKVLQTLLDGARDAQRQLEAAMNGTAPPRTVPPLPRYSSLQLRDRYFRLKGDPVLLFGMLYNREGPLLRWFANSQTDYGTELVAGGTRHDVERQPIWAAYHQYPDTHRVGWDNADHIIRDANSWEVVGPPVNVCLESPHSRDAIAAMIEKFERAHPGSEDHLVQSMGFEYTYVCYCPYTKRMWAQWLQQRHGDVGAANRIWGSTFAAFADVPMPRPEEAGRNRALWFDWASFNLHRFLEQIRWTRDQIRRWNPAVPLTVGSPYFAFDAKFWTGVDEEELADSGIPGVTLEENYEPDTLMPEYLHAVAGDKPVADFEYHGIIQQILPSFLHGDAAISMWWWNDEKHWTANEPINEWTTSFPQSYTIPLSDIAASMRDSLDLRRLGGEISTLASAPRPVALLYSKSTMLQDPAQYLPELRRLYNESQSLGLYVGLTTEKRILAGDLERRRMLVLPSARFLPSGVSDAILRWVEQGGTLVVSPDSLLADEYGRPSGLLQALGARLLRRESPMLKHGETAVNEYNRDDLPRLRFSGDSGLEAAGGRQVLEGDAALVAARFQDGSPALLRVRRGRGTVYWLAAPLTSASWRHWIAGVAEEAGLKPELQVMPDVEYRVTSAGGHRLAYLYNNSDARLRVSLRATFEFTKIIDRRTETALQGSEVMLPAGETAILEFR